MGYIILGGIFIASDISATVMFCKFLDLHLNSFAHFQVPAGTLIYPITFLISDIVTEVYGKKNAEKIVITSFIANLYVVFLIAVVGAIPATSFSVVSNEEFNKIFSLTSSAFIASACAFIISQFTDIKIFYILKCISPNKLLWLRNSVSTIISQILDTSIFFFILFIAGAISLNNILSIFLSTITLKAIIAILDTPFFYAGVSLLRIKEKYMEKYKALAKQKA